MGGKRQASLLDMFGMKSDPLSISLNRASEKVTKKKKVITGRKNLLQMGLDAGQKEIGCITCGICGMVYNKGTDDERTHTSYCRSKLTITGTDDEDIIEKDTHIIRPGSKNRSLASDVLNRFSQSSVPLTDDNTLVIKTDGRNVIKSALVVTKVHPPKDNVIAVVAACFPQKLTPSVAGSLYSATLDSLVYEYTMTPDQLALQPDVHREPFPRQAVQLFDSSDDSS
eukprot:TRINITY_DN31047_c0_g1_i1.p1 TRINITY_DN31047_c0_g1~~TRINITY_DN31047_c0_g1_i1.p1  ORF type:complete len:243 (+),score=63.76 TRINITY_DN31047_c0_g1_i1:53-730(+)